MPRSPLPRESSPTLADFTANLTLAAGNADEVIYGLGQGNWTPEGGCPAAGISGARIVPLERNGQKVNLQQRKFHVSIPFVYSTAGYGFLFNMPGYGDAAIGAHGVGGASWSAHAALFLDFWITALPRGVAAPDGGPIYKQYADATGHAPPLRESAFRFWQSRNRCTRRHDRIQPCGQRVVACGYVRHCQCTDRACFPRPCPRSGQISRTRSPCRSHKSTRPSRRRSRSASSSSTTRTSCTTATLRQTPRATPTSRRCRTACELRSTRPQCSPSGPRCATYVDVPRAALT